MDDRLIEDLEYGVDRLAIVEGQEGSQRRGVRIGDDRLDGGGRWWERDVYVDHGSVCQAGVVPPRTVWLDSDRQLSLGPLGISLRGDVDICRRRDEGRWNGKYIAQEHRVEVEAKSRLEGVECTVERREDVVGTAYISWETYSL